MKKNARRLRSILNFLAFNLLFFALYLNFIKKDPAAEPLSAIPATAQTQMGQAKLEPIDLNVTKPLTTTIKALPH